jgi:hypothetical protein
MSHFSFYLQFGISDFNHINKTTPLEIYSLQKLDLTSVN